MKRFLFLFPVWLFPVWLFPVSLSPLLIAATPAAADTGWVQAVADGFEARYLTESPYCPTLETNKGRVAMTVRAQAVADFPLLCAVSLPAGAAHAAIDGTPLPLPVTNPQRILVLGDTGCRIAGDETQACNDPAQWPFPVVARAAAALKPDLIIHLGDYLYRETPCPAGAAGCAGSPYGDNWAAWQADFFTPAAPLLAAAPVVLVRGNHEDCGRMGAGWLRLMGPGTFSTGPCKPHLPLYTVDLGEMRLAVMDDATAPETAINKADLPSYAAELAGLAAIPAPVWFVHHRPIWAAISGPLGLPVGGNLTLMAAAAEAGGKTLIPDPPVTLMLSGHIHSFQILNYDSGVPPQIVAGNGGDSLHDVPRILKGTIFQGHSGVSVLDGLSVGGFGFLLMTRMAEGGWSMELFDGKGAPERTCHFTPRKDDTPGRLACDPRR
jgi:hypothetical protein